MSLLCEWRKRKGTGKREVYALESADKVVLFIKGVNVTSCLQTLVICLAVLQITRRRRDVTIILSESIQWPSQIILRSLPSSGIET